MAALSPDLTGTHGLSARARQFYGKLGRAAVDDVRGLPATIVVGEQTATDRAADPSHRRTIEGWCRRVG